MPGRLPRPCPADSWAFFLDVDGTLLDYAERPDAVRAEPAIVQLLAGLRAAAGGALALISGRPVGDIDALFAPLRFPAAGLHGIERRDALGRLHTHALPEKPLRRAAARLAAFSAQHSGVIFEDKGLTLALHYRQAPQLEQAAHGIAAAVLAGLGDGVELQRGKMVIEIKPGGRDKGVAIEDFLREVPFHGRTPVFVGDDLTDEYGFSVVNRLGGHSVKVGAGETGARWRLEDAASVRDWLERCVAALRAGGSEP
ncbi:MAG: trehalose-phosphatase [Acidobacteria bacterium RIFCSPLOWO2_12_FULL_67_14b]|nr:MAG: trehalose-phosphatase [Acidobacteria bacterium RIFCSPLOWO2_12_FULL_67_14b]